MNRWVEKLNAYARLDRSVRLFLIVTLIHSFGYLGIYVVLMNLYLNSLGFGPEFIGYFNGISALVSALSAFPAGLIGGRLGLRGTTAAGYVVMALGVALTLLTAPLLPEAWWPPALIIAGVVSSCGAGLILVNIVPYLMGIAPENQRDMAFTFMGVSFALGALAGNLLAGFLPGLLVQVSRGAINQSTALNLVLWLFIPSFLACLVILLQAQPAPPIMGQSLEAAREKPPYGLLVFLGVLLALFLFAEGSYATFLNLYLAEELALSTVWIGTIFASGKLLTIAAAPLLLLGFKRLGSGWTMSWAHAVMGICALMMAFFPVLSVVITAVILYGPLSNFCITARTRFSQDLVTPRWRTMASAILTFSPAVGMGGSGLVGGWVIASVGYTGLFLLSTGVTLAGFLLYTLYHWINVRAHPRVKAEAPTA